MVDDSLPFEVTDTMETQVPGCAHAGGSSFNSFSITSLALSCW